MDEARGPLYWRISAALARDIQTGRLSAGEQLPTHRLLARELGVTVNTVTKAYAEAERNNLVVSRTGRGTFVKSFPEEMENDAALPRVTIDFGRNITSSTQFNPIFNRLFGALSRRGSLHGLLEYQPNPGANRHRAAGARWLKRRGIDANPDQIIVCNGAQEGLFATLSAITRPRDTVLTEKLNYTGIRFIADILHINLRGVETDDQGLIPEALEHAYRHEDNVAAVLANPTNHNPTNAHAPLERRMAIAKFAGQAGLFLIEDDTFGHLSANDTPTYATIAPDRCIYICGMSKSIAAGFRLGYVLACPSLRDRLINSLNKIHGSSPALTGEIAALLIEQGSAEEIVAWHRDQARIRQLLACDVLGLDSTILPPSYHRWIDLPEPWRADDFAAELRTHGVLISPADKFSVDRSPAPHAFRLAMGAEPDMTRLKEGLKVIAHGLSLDSNHLLPRNPGEFAGQ